MYPAHLFALFPPFPREERVFVAMSFDSRFDDRWHNVIDPAIRTIEVNGKRLEPIRLDTRCISDSILTEIISGIRDSRLVFADISSLGYLDKTAIRSSNVLYEVGLAQAVRLPEEVILFRSDEDSLLFDVSNIRVNSYSPDEAPEEARKLVIDAMLNSLRELDLRRHLAVQKAADMLDQTAYWILTEASNGKNGVAHPTMKTFGNVVGNAARVAAINRMLELGLLRTKYAHITPADVAQNKNKVDFEWLRYECTEFGYTVFRQVTEHLLSPELKAEFEKAYMAEEGRSTRLE